MIDQLEFELSRKVLRLKVYTNGERPVISVTPFQAKQVREVLRSLRITWSEDNNGSTGVYAGLNPVNFYLSDSPDAATVQAALDAEDADAEYEPETSDPGI